MNKLFEDASNFDSRFEPSYTELKKKVDALRELGSTIVLTSGSFDVLHEGHSMYLEAARNVGDFLVVGVDSDTRVRVRKGAGRPIVPELERIRMVTHQRGVGLVTLKQAWDKPRELIQAVAPHVMVTTAGMYDNTAIRALESYGVGQVIVLDRMATVSTTARLRDIILRNGGTI